jgi:hypothetical protein
LFGTQTPLRSKTTGRRVAEVPSTPGGRGSGSKVLPAE